MIQGRGCGHPLNIAKRNVVEMYLILVIVAALAALGFAAYNVFFVKKLD